MAMLTVASLTYGYTQHRYARAQEQKLVTAMERALRAREEAEQQEQLAIHQLVESQRALAQAREAIERSVKAKWHGAGQTQAGIVDWPPSWCRFVRYAAFNGVCGHSTDGSKRATHVGRDIGRAFCSKSTGSQTTTTACRTGLGPMRKTVWGDRSKEVDWPRGEKA